MGDGSGMVRLFFLLSCACFTIATTALTELQDPLDPFSLPSADLPALEDREKSAEQLIIEAEALLTEQRLLDARSKLLLAIQKEPDNFIPYSMLSGYYLIHVGHFKLALKYTLKAKELFTEQNGPPPYQTNLQQYQHGHLLNLLSQARLNLDDYSGALAALDQYADLGYHDNWYAGSRSWILMKLGRMDEAVSVARLGTMIGGEPGRTLNILGILLSMKGEREASIQIFRQAVAHEFSLGELGQPATPLNNVGEVYRETFDEKSAERSWVQATGLPDGCEHVLPSLNLATLRIEQLNLRGAKQAIDNFEACVAQFPLRSGDEHRALVHLARGRIALYSGQPDLAIEHFNAALERQQWFGKIGAKQEDLELGVRASLAEALIASNNRQKLKLKHSIKDSIRQRWFLTKKSLLSWWQRRKAMRIFIEDLDAMDDLFVRSTDSLIDYPRLGHLLEYLGKTAALRRIELELAQDKREDAKRYYHLYQAHIYMSAGQTNQAAELLDKLIAEAREPADNGLKLQALLLKMQNLSTSSALYQRYALEAFKLNRAALLQAGLSLPVNISLSSSLDRDLELHKYGFSPVSDRELDLIISGSYDQEQYSLRLSSRSGALSTITVRGKAYPDVINQFIDSVFSQQLG